MKFLHTMLRVHDLEKSLHFFTEILGLKVKKKTDYPDGQFTLVFLESEGSDAQIELTHNWDSDEVLEGGRNFGHIAFEVDNIYETCQRLMDQGVVINRPPRDGRMAFAKTPDGISLEFLQKGGALEILAPWKDMPNTGSW